MSLCTYCYRESFSAELPTAQPTSHLNGSALSSFIHTEEKDTEVWKSQRSGWRFSPFEATHGAAARRPHTAATQLIQLSLSAISLLHSICWGWLQTLHTHTQIFAPDTNCWHTFYHDKSQKKVVSLKRSALLQKIFRYFWYFKEVHSARRFGVVKLETQKAGGGKESLPEVPESVHLHRQTDTHRASYSLSFLFFFSYIIFFFKKVPGKKLH